MKDLNICIDIDGTITDAYFWLNITNKYFNKNITEQEITQYYIHEVMGIKQEEYDKFYEENKIEIHTHQKIREDAQSVIKRLSSLHSIYFVTARDKSLTMLTYSYLKNNQIPYDDLFVLGSHHKVNKAKELNCNVFVEDNYDNAVELSNAGFMVLLIDTGYNKKPLNDNIVRVYNWEEIYSIINKLLLQSKAM
ncbi:MAG: 5' nucleotidase, NT5C type [Clostridium sp.]|uniref:5' nucleotidase, NT5C type n=1 Tax=Clostridium sp. TaxID=1506 RepID=UPI003D6CE472